MTELPHGIEVWSVDFEYKQPINHLPEPHCMVARELRTNRLIKLWLGDNPPAQPPFDVTNCIYVAYNAVAEALCHRVLAWPMPTNVIDLYAEFRILVADRRKELKVDRLSLLSALRAFGLHHISADLKEKWRDVAIRGGDFTDHEKTGLMNYCQEDVDGAAALLQAMLPNIDLPRAFLRGRFSVAAAEVQDNGIPVDLESLQTIQGRREEIRTKLIQEVDQQFHVFVDEKFSTTRFLSWVKSRGIVWPALPSGRPKLDRDTFSDMSKIHPFVQPLHELRKTLTELKNQSLEATSSGRCHVSPGTFGTLTGRNSPSTSEFILSRAKWWRYLIHPSPGHRLIYLDWKSQEFAIAAALSGDEAMMKAYRSGDVYLGFGKACGAVAADASKSTHPEERRRFKVAALALQFGIGSDRLGTDLGGGPLAGVRMIERYKDAFPAFAKWSTSQSDKAALGETLLSPFGFRLRADALNVKPLTFKNFPVQATGADMMRIAVILMGQSGVKVCAMVHDGFLVEAPVADCDSMAATADTCMRAASTIVLNGFEIDVDVETFADRFRDPEGLEMWGKVCDLAGIVDSDPNQTDLGPRPI